MREITELVRKEAQMKLKYHVALAQKQIREDLNERVKEEVKSHARMQKASLSPCDGGEAMMLVVKQQPDGTSTFRKRLEKKELRRRRRVQGDELVYERSMQRRWLRRDADFHATVEPTGTITGSDATGPNGETRALVTHATPLRGVKTDAQCEGMGSCLPPAQDDEE